MNAQGISSKRIRYDSRSEAYVIDPSLHLQSSVRDTVLSLCELGWLFGRVTAYVNQEEALASTRGLVTQAFGFALQVFLIENIILV